MQALFQTFFSTVFVPSSLKERAHRRYWWQAALFILVITALQMFSLAGKYEFSAAQLGTGIALCWGSSVLTWWLLALLLHFTSDLLGGRGRFADTMTGLGLASLPFIFCIPLSSLPNMLGRTGYTLALLGNMGLVFWGLTLCVIALSAAQAFSIDRAIGSVILGFVFALALLLGGTLLGGLQVFFWVSQLLT